MTDVVDPVKVAYVNDIVGRQQQLVVNMNKDIANVINDNPYNGNILEVDYLRLVNNAYNLLDNKFLINKVNNLPVGSAIDTPFSLVDYTNQVDLETFLYNPLYWGDQIAIHMIQEEIRIALLVIIKSQANVDTCYTPLDDPALQAYDKYMFLFLEIFLKIQVNRYFFLFPLLQQNNHLMLSSLFLMKTTDHILHYIYYFIYSDTIILRNSPDLEIHQAKSFLDHY
jgi:hypothetical protein